MVSQIDSLIKNFKPSYVGPVDSRLGAAGQLVNVLSKERESWLAESAVLESSLRYGRFGATLTPEELARALDELPNKTMSDNQWVAAANAWKKSWGTTIDERLKTLKPGGMAKGEASASPALIQQLQKDYPGVPESVIREFLGAR